MTRSKRFAALGIWALALVGLAVVALVPVDWPTTSMPRTTALMNLGPVSSYVVPGQTLVPREHLDSIVLLVNVGGPFGATIPLRLVVYDSPEKTSLLAAAESIAVSKPDRFDAVWFRFEHELDVDVPVYFELEIPLETPWPMVIAATREDVTRPDGQVYLRGEAGFGDQDIAYQLFRNENLVRRLPLLWFEHRASLVVAAATLIAVYLTLFGVVMIVLGKVVSNPLLAGIPALCVVVIAAGVYVYAFS